MSAPYRASGRGAGIEVVLSESSWWRRFRRALGPGIVAPTLGTGAMLGLVVGSIGALFTELRYALVVFAVGCATGILLMLGAVLLLALRSLFPPTHDAALPMRIVFQPSGLGVEPRNGDPFTTAWSYVAAYRASSTALELVLLTAPPLKLDLSKLDAARRSRLVGLAVMNRVPEVK